MSTLREDAIFVLLRLDGKNKNEKVRIIEEALMEAIRKAMGI